MSDTHQRHTVVASGDGNTVESVMAIVGGLQITAAKKEWDGKEKPRRFKMELYNGGALVQAWADAPIVIDLSGLTGTDRSRPALKDHNPSLIVGHTTAVSNDGRSLQVEGVISGTGAVARDVVATADNGFPWQSSIQATVERMEYVEAGVDVEVNGQLFTGPVYVARQSTFKEASFVALGADDTSSANMAAALAAARGSENTNSQKGTNAMNFEKWLQARGKVLADLTDTERATLRAQYDAEAKPKQKADDGAAGTVAAAARPAASDNGHAQAAADNIAAAQTAASIEAMRKHAADEIRRQARVREIAASYPDISAKAVEEAWTDERTELEVLRAGRPTGPAIHSGRSDPAVGGEVMQAALMMSCGISGDSQVKDGTDAKIVEAASKRYRYGLGLQQLLLEAASARGYVGPQRVSKGNLREVLAYAMPPMPMQIHAGQQFSSLDIGGILGNTANKALMMGFMGIERSWDAIAAITSQSNFHTHTHYRMTGSGQYEKVAPGGEIAHGTLGEESHTLKVDTYGLMYGIDRQQIINDELGALTDVPRRLGRGAALKINDIFWEAFLDNAAFFTALRGNLQTGAAASALDITGLTNVEAAFRNQTDPDGKPLGLEPRKLLVPNALAASARQLMNSVEVRETAGAATSGTANPFAGAFDVVVSSYLSNSSYTGYSTTAWYLLADPQEEATMAIAFLNGQQAPTIEQADANFDVLGIQMRGYHDFGVSQWEYRAGVKASGA